MGLPSIAEDLVRDINRHAEVVLAGVEAMAAADKAPSQVLNRAGIEYASVITQIAFPL